MVHTLIDLTKVLDVIVHQGTLYELCADAVANYYSGRGELAVHLRASLRVPESHSAPPRLVLPWLPAPQVQVEEVDVELASARAKNVFASWCRQVVSGKPRAVEAGCAPVNN